VALGKFETKTAHENGGVPVIWEGFLSTGKTAAGERAEHQVDLHILSRQP
jgi:hypothetical protein